MLWSRLLYHFSSSSQAGHKNLERCSQAKPNSRIFKILLSSLRYCTGSLLQVFVLSNVVITSVMIFCVIVQYVKWNSKRQSEIHFLVLTGRCLSDCAAVIGTFTLKGTSYLIPFLLTCGTLDMHSEHVNCHLSFLFSFLFYFGLEKKAHGIGYSNAEIQYIWYVSDICQCNQVINCRPLKMLWKETKRWR